MKRRWLKNDRTRLLLILELAVVLPAAALILLNFLHLKSIQRDKVVEAAIQRDFQQMLAISEKKINKRAFAMLEEARREFPGPGDHAGESLEKILDRRPYAAHVFLYDQEKGLIYRSQRRPATDEYFREECERLSKVLGGWMPLEGRQLAERLQKATDEPPYIFFGNTVDRKEGHALQPFALFLVPAAPEGHAVIGGLAFDTDFLQRTFFPEMVNELAPDKCTGKSTYGHGVMMVRLTKDRRPIAASTHWDGGPPEVQRNLEEVFRGYTLAMRIHGTSVAAVSERWMRTSFLILGGLSLLLAGGILLTYHNVTREMKLARLKSDFVSNVSHELRTPLSLIRLYAETLELGRVSSPAKCEEYYRIMRKESERLSALINNILDFSRIEAGRKEYEFRETDLAELVRNTLESYRYQIEQQGFALEQNIAENLPPVRVDREAIARSIVNLVNNALKYSPEEKFLGVHVYRANGSVKLEVIDRGIGIPRNEQHKIFEKFYRAGDPLVHNTKGSGLGLSLVRHIVQAHGGEVGVESTPGKGSKFTISLPLDAFAGTAGAASDAAAAAAVPGGNARQPEGRPA